MNEPDSWAILRPWMLPAGGVLLMVCWALRCWLQRDPVLLTVGRVRFRIRESFIPILITGSSGSGKSFALLEIIRSLLTQTPEGRKPGLLVFDGKNTLVRDVQAMVRHLGREDDLVLLEVRPDGAQPVWQPKNVMNLLGKLPFSTSVGHLQAAAAARSAHREEEPFFVLAVQTLLIEVCKSIEVLGYDVTWANVARALQKEDGLQNLIRELKERQIPLLDRAAREPEARGRLAKLGRIQRELESFSAMPAGQLGGILASAKNWLATFANEEFAEVYSAAGSSFDLQESLDRGAIILVMTPARFRRERKVVQTLLKLEFYVAARRRFEQPAEELERKNIWSLIIDEAHSVLSSSEDSAGELEYLDTCRAARIVTAFATHGIASIEAAVGSVQSKVVAQNLPTRIFFRAADAASADEASHFIGRHWVWKEDRTTSRHGGSFTRRKEQAPRVSPEALSALRDHQAYVVKNSNGRKVRKTFVPPRGPDGKIPGWYWQKRILALLWPF